MRMPERFNQNLSTILRRPKTHLVFYARHVLKSMYILHITRFMHVCFHGILCVFLLVYLLYYLIAHISMIFCFDALMDFQQETHLFTLANSPDSEVLTSLLSQLKEDVLNIKD